MLKITSTKFWVAMATLIVAICVLFGADNGTVEKVSAVILALGNVIAYVFANVWQKEVAMQAISDMEEMEESNED